MALVQEKSDQITRRDPNAIEAVVAALAAKFGSDDLLAPSVRALNAFMSAPKPPKKVCDLKANSGVQTRQPPNSFDHEDRSEDLNQ